MGVVGGICGMRNWGAGRQTAGRDEAASMWVSKGSPRRVNRPKTDTEGAGGLNGEMGEMDESGRAASWLATPE